jgi:hypothetical protein
MKNFLGLTAFLMAVGSGLVIASYILLEAINHILLSMF